MEFKTSDLKMLSQRLEELASNGNRTAIRIQKTLHRTIEEVREVWHELDDLPLSEWNEEARELFEVVDSLLKVLCIFSVDEGNISLSQSC
ncbi:MAG TPA: hypothetical protein VNM22_07385 [Candidatus Limnocylindrales bacterium]|nr:hypothetical protein [Candidatus Limnocylindrales bacterium]